MSARAPARRGNLLAWQWRGYAHNHRDRLALVLHMVGVPMFVAGLLAAVVQLAHTLWFGAAIACLVALAGFALQGLAHRRERQPPEPFLGPADFFARLLAEQFITFPRFVLTGGWLRNLVRGPDRHQE